MGEEEKSGVESCPKFSKSLCPSSFRGEAPSSDQTLSNHRGRGGSPSWTLSWCLSAPRESFLLHLVFGFVELCNSNGDCTKHTVCRELFSALYLHQLLNR